MYTKVLSGPCLSFHWKAGRTGYRQWDSDSCHSVLPGYAANVGPKHTTSQLGEALTPSQVGLTGLRPTPSLLKYWATLLLVTVVPLSQPHIHLPSVVTELREMEGDYRKNKVFKSRPENDSRIEFHLCLFPASPTPQSLPVGSFLIMHMMSSLPALTTQRRVKTGELTDLLESFVLCWPNLGHSNPGTFLNNCKINYFQNEKLQCVCACVRMYTQVLTYMCFRAEGRKVDRGCRDGIARNRYRGGKWHMQASFSLASTSNGCIPSSLAARPRGDKVEWGNFIWILNQTSWALGHEIPAGLFLGLGELIWCILKTLGP